jgi:hypothetical protein
MRIGDDGRYLCGKKKIFFEGSEESADEGYM